MLLARLEAFGCGCLARRREILIFRREPGALELGLDRLLVDKLCCHGIPFKVLLEYCWDCLRGYLLSCVRGDAVGLKEQSYVPT